MISKRERKTRLDREVDQAYIDKMSDDELKDLIRLARVFPLMSFDTFVLLVTELDKRGLTL